MQQEYEKAVEISRCLKAFKKLSGKKAFPLCRRVFEEFWISLINGVPAEHCLDKALIDLKAKFGKDVDAYRNVFLKFKQISLPAVRPIILNHSLLAGPIKCSLPQMLQLLQRVKEKDQLIKMLLRYKQLGSFIHQRSLPAASFKTLDFTLEGFAAPFSTTLPRFCSLFPDVDAPFGSVGEFFHHSLENEKVLAHPPFLPFLLHLTSEKIKKELRDCESLLAIICFPCEPDAPYYKSLLEASQSQFVIEKEDYYFVNLNKKIKAKKALTIFCCVKNCEFDATAFEQSFRSSFKAE